MNPKHPSYRKVMGRATVIAAVLDRNPQWAHAAEVRQACAETWDATQGDVDEHLAVLSQTGVLDERACQDERGGHEYRDPGILGDWIADAGLEAVAESTLVRLDASAEARAGRWLLLLGHEVIAHASSLEALRLGCGPTGWPAGSVAVEVSRAYRREPTESMEVAT